VEFCEPERVKITAVMVERQKQRIGVLGAFGMIPVRQQFSHSNINIEFISLLFCREEIYLDYRHSSAVRYVLGLHGPTAYALCVEVDSVLLLGLGTG
jgi:DNA-dependent RNA polymerase auxiliary subunit epsilon